jgi:hypothetical protein
MGLFSEACLNIRFLCSSLFICTAPAQPTHPELFPKEAEILTSFQMLKET